MPHPDGKAKDDRVFTVAVRLLSELGYDGVTNRMIADAAGVGVETVVERYGGKHALYLTVFKRALQRRIDWVQAVEAVYTPDLDGFTRLLDTYLDLAMETPELGAFWMQRWLSDASDISELEPLFGGPSFGRLVELVRGTLADDLDVGMVMRTFSWTVLAFSQRGLVDTDGRRREPTDPATLQRFREHLHGLARHVIARPDGRAHTVMPPQQP